MLDVKTRKLAEDIVYNKVPLITEIEYRLATELITLDYNYKKLNQRVKYLINIVDQIANLANVDMP